MKKSENFEEELPAGFEEVYSLDAQSARVGILFTLADIVITAALVAGAYFLIRPEHFLGRYTFSRNIVFCVVLLAYIVLHELTHGAAYRLLTGRKLTFGMTLTVAYCGVPDIYVYRRTALISLLAPFVVWSAVFLAAAFLFTDPWDRFYAAMVFAIHFGGCVGDLYDTFLYLFRFRDPKTLMKDTGPKQTFYQKK